MTVEDPNIEFAKKLKLYTSNTEGFGDWLPDVLKKILKKNNTLDVTACLVLSKLCYWLSPRKNGKKKFMGSQLRLSIPELARQTLLSYSQTKFALRNLEQKYKYISRTNVGKYTYINLNVDILIKAITLHDPNFADKDGVISEITPIHIHKEQQRLLPRKFRTKNLEEDLVASIEKIQVKINTVEEMVEDKNNQIDNYYMSRAIFINVCNNTQIAFETKMKHDVSKEDLLDYYIYDAKLNAIHPAYSKLVFMYNNMRVHLLEMLRNWEEGLAETDKFLLLVYNFKLECTNVPDVYTHFLEVLDANHVPLFNRVLDLDFNQVKKTVDDKVSRLKSEKKDLASRLTVYTSELKKLKIEN